MRVLFVSLGCDKNRVDSEVMLGMLSDRGYEFTDDEEQAEAAVVNHSDAELEWLERLVGRRPPFSPERSTPY